MIYLASPYSSPSPDIRRQRYEDAVWHATELWKQGEVVFSPIAHSHPMALLGLSGEWEQWAEFDEAIIGASSELRVLMLHGWEVSRGIEAERRIAAAIGIPVTFMDPLR